eukprot:gene31976-40385_t
MSDCPGVDSEIEDECAYMDTVLADECVEDCSQEEAQAIADAYNGACLEPGEELFLSYISAVAEQAYVGVDQVVLLSIDQPDDSYQFQTEVYFTSVESATYYTDYYVGEFSFAYEDYSFSVSQPATTMDVDYGDWVDPSDCLLDCQGADAPGNFSSCLYLEFYVTGSGCSEDCTEGEQAAEQAHVDETCPAYQDTSVAKLTFNVSMVMSNAYDLWTTSFREAYANAIAVALDISPDRVLALSVASSSVPGETNELEARRHLLRDSAGFEVMLHTAWPALEALMQIETEAYFENANTAESFVGANTESISFPYDSIYYGYTDQIYVTPGNFSVQILKGVHGLSRSQQGHRTGARRVHGGTDTLNPSPPLIYV